MKKCKVVCLFLVGCVFSLLLFPSPVQGKSVFATASHSASIIKAYKISDDELVYQDNVEAEDFANGITGLCVWSNIERMFVTYEQSNKIAWASTKTLQREDDDEIEAPEINLAGMVVDEELSRLYVLCRTNGHLYTYTFNEQADTLELLHPNDPDYPDRLYQPLISSYSPYQYGLALYRQDLQTARLYVTDGSSMVRCYDVASWGLIETINVGRSAIGIDVDANEWIYTGNCGSIYNTPHIPHTYLIRYKVGENPSDPETLIEKDMETYVTDISIDRDSGLVYVMTRREVVTGRFGAVEVYDPTNWSSTNSAGLVQTDIKSDQDYNGPAGIAVGPLYKDPNMYIDKNDDTSACVSPDDTITYTIGYRPGPDNETNVVITDRLPDGVDFVSADPATGSYDLLEHTYTWNIGSLTGGDPNQYLELEVQVNNWANPAGELINNVEIESDDSYSPATETTAVCCWDSGIIYVDRYATGHQTGTDWDNAYTDLQDALARTAAGCGSEIWVARGTYSPGRYVDDSFIIPANVELYGGFAGMETARDDRDHTRYRTILTGYINETTRNKVVVTMGDSTTLDGFVVKKGNWRGIEGVDVDFSVYNCTVEDNTERGINCENGNLTARWCNIKNNSQEGIYHKDSETGGYTLSVENCKISGNLWDGIKIVSSAPQIKNSFIYRNGFGEYSYYYGINLLNPSSSPIIRNDTIAHNGQEGIKFVGSTNAPDIRNCIIWHNNAGDWHQLSGYGGTYYTCITDPNDIEGDDPNSFIPTARGNIKCNPKFAYSSPYPRNYHLKADSPCIDRGHDLYVGVEETDIDNGDRIVDWLGSTTNDVDMGADEFSCEDVENIADFNSNGIVNMAEFAMFSAAWLSEDPNDTGLPDPNWNGRCDIDDSGIIDLADLVAIADNWVWTACWRSTSEGIWMMMAGGGGESSAMTAAESQTAVETETAPAPIMTLEEQIAQLTDILDWLEKISQDEDIINTITEEQWQAFIDDVLKMLENLKSDYDSD